MLIVCGLSIFAQQTVFADNYRSHFTPVRPAHYIAALSDPDSNTGNTAETWGYWPLDPGPRGVKLTNYEKLVSSGGVTPAQCQFDSSAVFTPFSAVFTPFSTVVGLPIDE
jgi:hypothetical protein